jgi:hypothetical protein
MREMKINTFRKPANRLLVALLVASLPASLSVTAQEVNHSLADKQWSLRYEAGPHPIKSGTKIAVTVGRENIAFATGDGKQFLVPVSAVTEVAYDKVVTHASETKFFRFFADDPQGFMFITVPAALMIAHAFKSTRHFVQVVWKEGHDQKNVWFKVKQNDYVGFLAELERVTGRRVTDFAKDQNDYLGFLTELEQVTGLRATDFANDDVGFLTELVRVAGRRVKNLAKVRAELQEELGREKHNKVSIRLDRPVWVNGKRLRPDRYQLVLLEREGVRNQLYFFRGRRVRPKRVVATTRVEIIPPKETATASRVVYEEKENFPTTITEVRLPEKTLRFPAAFQLLDPQRIISREGRLAAQFEEGNNWFSYASYMDYKGMPAVRFPVFHQHSWFSCVGFLYVTNKRVAYEPSPKQSRENQKHAFDVARAHLKEIERVNMGRLIPGIRFVLPDRTYIFSTFFERGPEFRAPHQLEEGIQEAVSNFLDFLFLTVYNFEAVEKEFQHVLTSREKALSPSWSHFWWFPPSSQN